MADVTPNNPSIIRSTSNDVKIIERENILLNDQTLPIELMTDLIFENIGGQELINIARNDIVNGQNVLYQPIKNLTSINFQYNPQNILGLQNTDVNYFRKFSINFNDRVPTCGTGPNCEIVYIDSETGDLVINVINMGEDEQVEVQILNGGLILNDTIYYEVEQ